MSPLEMTTLGEAATDPSGGPGQLVAFLSGSPELRLIINPGSHLPAGRGSPCKADPPPSVWWAPHRLLTSCGHLESLTPTIGANNEVFLLHH